MLLTHRLSCDMKIVCACETEENLEIPTEVVVCMQQVELNWVSYTSSTCQVTQFSSIEFYLYSFK